jgi:prophage antirepressor-like protein
MTNPFKIVTPYGNLHLTIGEAGARWLVAGPLTDLLGLSLKRDVLTRAEGNPHFWRIRAVDGRVCIPVERCPDFFKAIRDEHVRKESRPALQWFRTHALQVLLGFRIPPPAVPLLVEEPEPIRSPVLTQVPPTKAMATIPPTAGLRTFSFGSALIRTVMVDGEPWWVATDVCTVLGVINSTQAVERLDADERSMFNIGRQGNACIINESGLYSLVLGSRKPDAKAFKKWITSEVLPAIRKTGSYSTQSVIQAPRTLSEALRLALDLEEQRADLETKVQAQQPAVAWHDKVAGSIGLQAVIEVAKALGAPPHRFWNWLYAEHILYPVSKGKDHPVPAQEYLERGYFEVKVGTYERKNGDISSFSRTWFTAKGVAWVGKRWLKAEAELQAVRP